MCTGKQVKQQVTALSFMQLLLYSTEEQLSSLFFCKIGIHQNIAGIVFVVNWVIFW